MVTHPTNYGHRSFSFHAFKQWNCFPFHNLHLPTIESLKHVLTTHLLSSTSINPNINLHNASPFSFFHIFLLLTSQPARLPLQISIALCLCYLFPDVRLLCLSVITCLMIVSPSILCLLSRSCLKRRDPSWACSCDI